MAKSLFHNNAPESPRPDPRKLIESEIDHLKKGSSTRHGPAAKTKSFPWLIILALCGLGWLYLMDTFLHAWYKGEAVRTYLYLHNYGTGPQVDKLIATRIFSIDEVEVLNHRQGSFQDYYASPEAANRQAETIIHYMTEVDLLHAGKYEQLDPVGKVRYFLFIRPGIFLPTKWSELDPAVAE